MFHYYNEKYIKVFYFVMTDIMQCMIEWFLSENTDAVVEWEKNVS